MKAIIWKDWRENTWPTVSAIVFSSLICAWMLHQALTANSSWETVWAQGVVLPFTVLAPLLGALTGFTQIYPELKRDQWAFLIHRPLTHSTIFWGKVVAGLTLYLLPATLPLLGLFLWLSRPGHTPGPFIPQMFLAPTADILGGVIFYFAAILATLRLSKSRLSYVRVLAFAVSFVCAASSSVMPEFWQSLVVVALGILIVGSAAWGSFVSLDNYEKQPIKARAGLVITLYIGITATIIAGIVVIASTLPSRPSDYSYTDYKVAKSGRVVKAENKNGNWSVRDLQGKPIAPTKGQDWNYEGFINEAPLYLKRGNPDRPSYRSPQRYAMYVNYAVLGLNWFFNRNKHWFEAYSDETHLPVVFVGPNGFSQTPPQTNFGKDLDETLYYYGGQLFRFGSNAYWVDFKTRQLSLLTANDGIVAATDIAAGSYLDNTAWGAVTATSGHLRFFSRQGQFRFAVPIEADPQEYAFVSIAPISDNKLILIQKGNRENKGIFTSLPTHVREISSNGQALKRYDLPVLAQPKPVDSSNPHPFAVLTPAAPLFGLFAYGYIGSVSGKKFATEMWQHMGREAIMWKVFAMLVVLASLIYAALAWRFGLRHQVSPKTRWLWTISVFWTGLFGLLTLLVLREWPPRIACETCGKKRSVAQETCAHCDAAWPVPALDGTEIFA